MTCIDYSRGNHNYSFKTKMDHLILSKEDCGYSAKELGQEWIIWKPEGPGTPQEEASVRQLALPSQRCIMCMLSGILKRGRMVLLSYLSLYYFEKVVPHLSYLLIVNKWVLRQTCAYVTLICLSTEQMYLRRFYAAVHT